MKNMQKINESISRDNSRGNSDAYRKFKEQFDKLFRSDEIPINDEEFEELYVDDLETEREINEFRFQEMNDTNFFVGYTGIGKSTCIRHCFELGIKKKPIINSKQNEIVFPTFLDGFNAIENPRFDLTKRISAVCTEIEEKYPDLRFLMKSDSGKKEFYQFIREHTGFALEDVNPIEIMDLDDVQTMYKKLEAAYSQSPFEYQANRLKFYIKKKYNEIQRLVIILDDIESLPDDYQKKVIEHFLKFHDCMKNTDYPKNRKYCIKLLISIRPHTYRILQDDRFVETFARNPQPIVKKIAVPLELIFKKRFDHYTKFTTIGNKDTWDKSYGELCNMNNSFEGKYKEMICNLCFLDIRKSLAAYARVFANRFWVQRNKPKKDHFAVYASDYSFNNINVIRSLACDEESVYWGDKHDIIPSFFYTTKQEDYSICCLLIMRYFRSKKGNNDYGINASYLEDVLIEWKEVLGEKLLQRFDVALKFLYEKKILRKSIKDFEDQDESILTKNNRLYISPRGNELFDMLNRDSVLLEMLRENIWRDYENREYSLKTSYELMQINKQNEIFGDLLEYLDYLCDKEDDILTFVEFDDRMERYIEIFEKGLVVDWLLKGVKRSMDYSGYTQDLELLKKYNTLQNKIERIQVNRGMGEIH